MEEVCREIKLNPRSEKESLTNLDNEKQKKDKKTNEYLKYSGMAMEMAVLIIIGIFAGKYLDKQFGFEKPLLTLVGALLGTFIFLFKLVKDTSKK